MSWEGYSQNFCTKGHFFEGTAGHEGEPPHCAWCGGPIALCNIVDDTNCDAVGVIPPALIEGLLLRKQETGVCDLGHEHVTRQATYRVPTEEELKTLRHCWDFSKREHVPLRLMAD